MYHHIEEESVAKENGYASLTVTPKIFDQQLTYLDSQHYTTIDMQQLINFFDQNIPLPSKSVLLTFDDAYKDFAKNTAPILNNHRDKATIFVPTGLMGVTNYLSWEDLKTLGNNSNYLFANHTWSHHSSISDTKTLLFEITTADTQLKDHALGQVAIFAYPYGTPSTNAETILEQLSYKLAFTTTHGTYLCKKQRLTLPRIRIGNAQLNNYGL